jgi:hypothetical protein
MFSRIGRLTSLTIGHKLKASTPTKTSSNHPAIFNNVELVTNGFGMRIINVVIIPKPSPVT